MVRVRRNNVFLLGVIILLISLLAVSYNMSVRTMLAKVSDDNMNLLEMKSGEIIAKLQNAENEEQWNNIIYEYAFLDIVIEDENGEIVFENDISNPLAESIFQRWSFEYNGKEYSILTSVHLLDNFSNNMGSLLNFVVAELLICITILLITVVLLYLFIIRPYKAFYDSMEEYEKSGKILKRNFRGYVGKVYNRFFILTKNLEHNDNNQKRIIASISHDIKTPLTSIMGYTERLSKDNISEERKKAYIDTIYSKALQISQIVNEFDEYLSYNNSGKIHTEHINLRKFFSELKTEFEDELSSCLVESEFICNVNDEVVSGDKEKLLRVFSNVVGNSVKHMENENGGRIIFSVSADKNEAFITIADNGKGVKDENLEVIFEPFYTSDKGRKVAGLGLSICREIIESHKGRIYARHSEMGGLEVVIRLPLCTDSER